MSNGDVRTVLEEDASWGDKVAQYSKSIAATGTSALALGTSLGALLPAEQAAGITAAVALVTGFITWLVSNTEILRQTADSFEELGEGLTGRDL